MNEKRLPVINFSIVIYFVLIYLIDYLQIDFLLIGVFREIMTIPFLMAQIVFLPLSIYFWIKRKTLKPLTVFSIIFLAVSTLITMGSFFI